MISMKKVFTAMGLSTCLSSFAQVDILPAKPNYNEYFFKKYIPIQKMNLWSFPKATLKESSAWGNIYTLPVDNMPCLVPDIGLFKPIPNSAIKGFPYSLMLNPFKKEYLIPAQ